MPSQQTGSGFPLLDIMLSMQRISAETAQNFQRTMMGSLENSMDQMLTFQRSFMALPLRQQSRALVPMNESQSSQQSSQQVIGFGEEVLNVTTRRIPGQVTRVRRVVTKRPVEQEVHLRDETVVIERRHPTGKMIAGDALAEREFEMRDSTEMPVVSKEFRPLGEVVIRKNVSERTQPIKDTVYRSEVKVLEEPQRMPSIIRPDQPEIKSADEAEAIIMASS